jgi:methane monooxygenase PmoA-like
MRVLEAIRTAEAPAAIAAEHIRWEGDGSQGHPVVHGIAGWIERATTAQATFSELGAPWARRPEATDEFTLDGRTVALRRDGSQLAPTSSPRPYLHPVTTLAGTVVTDQMPLDHSWHLGAGVALQDVNGINFWGGRTYTREASGYVWRPDHGRITCTSSLPGPGRLAEELRWDGPDGQPVLTERRRWHWERHGDESWKLQLAFTLAPAGRSAVSLGSPGSNGRPQGGYGGFFWRLPACTEVKIRTSDAAGEELVHGSRAPWLAWSARFGGAAATLLFLAPPEAPDPWFVRSKDYPGVGSALAWDSAVALQPGETLTRSITVLLADGEHTDSQLAELAAGL